MSMSPAEAISGRGRVRGEIKLLVSTIRELPTGGDRLVVQVGWDREGVGSFPTCKETYKHPEWKGPWLGPKPSDECKRDFTDEQLRAGQGIVGLQAGSNKGATQAGQSIGATRKILLGK